MALEENVASRVIYKAHSTGVITANTEPVLTVDPAITGGQELRRVTSTLTPAKATYQSAEIRPSRQLFDMRHGVRQVSGEITGELSPGTYIDLIEAVHRATKVATFSKDNTVFTSCAADTPTSKFTVAASTWAAQGFRVGDVIRFTNMSNALNNADFLITALSTVDATVTPAPTTQGADATFNVARLGDKLSIPLTGQVSRKFLFEHAMSDTDNSILFSECRMTSFGLSLPATGLNTIRLGVTGRDFSVVSGASSPFFTAPTAVTSTGLTAAVNGVLSVAGTKIGIVTGLDINQVMAVDAPAVVGQNFVPEIFLGRSIVTGTLTAFFQDATLINYFINETEVEVACWLTTTSATQGPGIAIFLPRVKFSTSTMPLQGEAGLPITLAFTALERASATGVDQTTACYAEWTV